MSKRKKTPDWDRGNGWCRTKDEWQDYHKAEDKTVTLEELSDMWCPASGSTISIDVGHLSDGLIFTLFVGPKEYRLNPGGKTQSRKPTMYGTNQKMTVGIPKPGYEQFTAGATWVEKMSWSSAVKTLLNEIIPAYENANSEAVPMRAMV